MIQIFTKIGNPGKDGNECAAHCPTKCSPDMMPCYGGSDSNNCEMGDFCAPAKGMYVFTRKQ